MSIEVMLLRGINVGGHGKMRMSDLRKILKGLGARNVETLIQSGNAIYQGSLNAVDVSEVMNLIFGFRPKAMVLSAGDLETAIAVNPFPVDVPGELFLYFCETRPEIDPEVLTAHSNGVERWHLAGKVFYLHTPGGLSQSKLAPKVERLLGVPATGRNWNTVTKLHDLAAVKGAG